MYSSFYSTWKANRVKDIEAPEMYSQIAIYWFSVVFSVIAGSILLAINFKRYHQHKASWYAALFGLAFTVVEIYALSFARGSSTGLTLIINSAGAYIMNEYFWNKYIGADVKYSARSIWVPLIICLAITVPMVALIIWGGR